MRSSKSSRAALDQRFAVLRAVHFDLAQAGLAEIFDGLDGLIDGRVETRTQRRRDCLLRRLLQLAVE